MTPPKIVYMDSQQVGQTLSVLPEGLAPFEYLLGNSIALCFDRFMSQSEVQKALSAVYSAKASWTSGFGGEQFALGEVWYHYRETGASFSEYTARAAESIRTLEETIPGLYSRILGFLRQFTSPLPVSIRMGWAGPAVVIFPAHGRCAVKGGDIHYDWDGLESSEFEDPLLEAYSFVCMLSKPDKGGGLMIWTERYDSRRDQDIEHPKVPQTPAARVNYLLGQLWMFRSMVAHRIEPFDGERDRVCLTFHVVKRGTGWSVWF